MPQFNTGSNPTPAEMQRFLQALQANVEKILTPLSRTPYFDGVLLDNVTLLASGVNNVEHKLGRKCRGYFVTSKSAPADIYDYLNNTTFDAQRDKYLVLSTSADCVVNIWIF